jgi:alkanesulfonate monooxygenase SsuD/methylene tetrahydromethanopterin reductase-like flavin-dependent oxidoreductase (luciferase family)
MQTEDDLRPRLRRQLKAAVRDRDRIAVSALRDGIAALDNAEAVEPGRTFRLRAVNTSPVGRLALERPRSNAEFLIPNRSARSSEPRSRPGWQLPLRMSSMGRASALPSFGWAPMHCSQCLRAGAKATEA